MWAWSTVGSQQQVLLGTTAESSLVGDEHSMHNRTLRCVSRDKQAMQVRLVVSKQMSAAGWPAGTCPNTYGTTITTSMISSHAFIFSVAMHSSSLPPTNK